MQRILLASSKPGDVVLDPFSGTGTTAAVAKKLGRAFVGIEQDPAYVRLSRARLKAITPIEGDMLEIEKGKKSLPRVPFGALVENGWLKPGDRLWSPKKRFNARIRIDGSLTTGTRLDLSTALAPSYNKRRPVMAGPIGIMKKPRAVSWRRLISSVAATGTKWG